MKVFDVFPFYNELDLLEIRIHALSDVVDFFIVSEATYTFSGKKKPLYLSENLDRFGSLASRIIPNVVDLKPRLSAFETEWQQRNAIKSIINEVCKAEDVLLFGDADEIPRPECVPSAVQALTRHEVVHFAQDLFYYYLNLKEVSGTLLSATGEFESVTQPKWLGTKLMHVGTLGARDMDFFRTSATKQLGRRIADGGWHFSFVGSEGNLPADQRVKNKIKAYAHQEYNNFRTLRRIKGRVESGSDVFDRDGAVFEVVPIDESFPRSISENVARYSSLILRA